MIMALSSSNVVVVMKIVNKVSEMMKFLMIL